MRRNWWCNIMCYCDKLHLENYTGNRFIVAKIMQHIYKSLAIFTQCNFELAKKMN